MEISIHRIYRLVVPGVVYHVIKWIYNGRITFRLGNLVQAKGARLKELRLQATLLAFTKNRLRGNTLCRAPCALSRVEKLWRYYIGKTLCLCA